MYRETASTAIERMPRRVIAAFVHACRFVRIDQDQTFLVLNQPNVNRQPARPLFVEQHIGDLSEAFPPGLHLGTSDLNKAGTNGVNFEHLSILNCEEPNQIYKSVK